MQPLAPIPGAPRSAMTRWRILRRYWLADHAWLRALLPNFHQVDENLFRSNHPGRRLLRKARRQGVRSVLSLRGNTENTPNILERDACIDLGLELRFIRMYTGHLPAPETLRALLRDLREMPKPILLHCKSGADRTGLAVTLYLHVLKGQPLEEARNALSWKFGHWSPGKAGIVHRLLDTYAADRAAIGIGFEDWVDSFYDPRTLTLAKWSGPPPSS